MQGTPWAAPQTIPGYEPGTWPPILIADQNRTIHAFSDQWIDTSDGESNLLIVYNQWTLENGWTTPVDILISPIKEARLTAAYLDDKGYFHVVFFGGDNTDANIYYSRAPAREAANGNAWSAPAVIGENAGDPEGSAIFENDQGTLFVMFNGRQYGNGLYVVSSEDGGNNWSNSTPIFYAKSDEPNIDLLKVVDGRSGWIHAIWGVYSEDGQGRGIYYSRSKDGQQWNESKLLADAEDGLGTQTPTIIQYNEKLIALFNLPPKVTRRESVNDGETWSDPSILFPRHVGVNGSLSMAIDSNKRLHLFFGQRIPGTPDIHGMWHSTWEDNHWVEPEPIVRGPVVRDDVGFTSFDPYEASSVVSQGNVLMVTWRTDPGLKGNGVWYSYKVLDAPETPLKEIPIPTQPTPEQSDSSASLSLDPQLTATPGVSPAINSLFVEKKTEFFGLSISKLLVITGVFLILVFFFFSVGKKRKK